jgi:hypothetical protein
VAQEALRVTNLKEIRKAFRRLDADTKKQLQRELKLVAEPVAETARQLAGRFGLYTASGIRARSSVGVAYVQQSRRKTTGQHPQFGALQMRQVLLPAVRQHERQILEDVNQVLERLARDFNTN